MKAAGTVIMRGGRELNGTKGIRKVKKKRMKCHRRAIKRDDVQDVISHVCCVGGLTQAASFKTS